MSQLPITRPDVYTEFMEDGFSVQLGSSNPFGQITVDQAIEETMNKDTQTAGGTKGFSLKPGAVTKYYLTTEYRSIYFRQLRDLIGQGRCKLSHPDLQGPMIKRDDADVQSLIKLIENNWLSHVSPDELDLICLTTGTTAPPDVIRDLLSALEKGEEAYQLFKQTRLDADPPSVKFHDKMAKQSLKTFSNVSTKTAHWYKAQYVILKAGRNLFNYPDPGG